MVEMFHRPDLQPHLLPSDVIVEQVFKGSKSQLVSNACSTMTNFTTIFDLWLLDTLRKATGQDCWSESNV